MKIAIVGNGIHASYKENGKFIDSCDLVIRLNKFIIEGYEQFIGSKIDIISLMLTGEGATAGILGHAPLQDYVKRAKYSEIWIPDKYRVEHTINRSRALEHFRLQSTHCFNFVNPDIYDSLMGKLQTISESIGDIRNHYYPDSGMTTIERCISGYSGAEIYVTGFDPHKRYPGKYYHKTNGEHDLADNRHPQKAQAILYDEYVSCGQLIEI